MAERQPPLFMDVSGVYSGDELGLPYRDLIGEGIIALDDLAVTAGAGNSVNIAEGGCWMQGDTSILQPNYRGYNDAPVNLGISVDPANPRKVLVVAEIIDETFAGTGRLWRVRAIHGTPAAVPVEPALPASAIPLSLVDVPAAAASSAAYTFTDRRATAKVGAGAASIASVGSLILRKTTVKVVSLTAALVDLLNGEITIPANAMGLDKVLRVSMFIDALQNNGAPAAGPRLQISLGGTIILDMTPAGVGVAASATRRAVNFDFEIMNLGAHDQQELKGVYQYADPAPTAAVGFADQTQGGHAYDNPFANRFSIATNVNRLLEVKVTPQTNSANCDVRLNGALIEII